MLTSGHSTAIINTTKIWVSKCFKTSKAEKKNSYKFEKEICQQLNEHSPLFTMLKGDYKL